MRGASARAGPPGSYGTRTCRVWLLHVSAACGGHLLLMFLILAALRLSSMGRSCRRRARCLGWDALVARTGGLHHAAGLECPVCCHTLTHADLHLL